MRRAVGPGALIAALLALAVAWAPGCDRGGALPELYPAPSFELTDESGNAFSSEDLSGEVWIVSFIFTHCTSVCPMITSQLANLQRRLRGMDVRFVSLSVDPERDTPDVLLSYSQRHHADLTSWTFLTGDKAEVRRVIVDGFHVALSDSDVPESDDILHARSLLLVDRHGTVRGAYPPEVAGMQRLQTDVSRLIQEHP